MGEAIAKELMQPPLPSKDHQNQAAWTSSAAQNDASPGDKQLHILPPQTEASRRMNQASVRS